MSPVIQKYVPHSETRMFYDTEQDFGTSTHEGLISIDVRGSSELKGVDKDRVLALVVLLAKGLDDIRDRDD